MQYQSAVPTEVIDWDAVSAIDPDLIRRTGDLTQLQPFISKFVGANMGQYESQVLTHPLAVRLCSILQVSLQYMSDVQKQLDEKVRRLETRLEDKNEEMKKLEVAFTKADELLRRKMQSTEKCPICLKKFKNFDFVDQHFERRHPEHLEEWYSLRNKRPMRNRPQKNSDIDQIVKQIADLQKKLNQSGTKNATLQKMVNRLSKELDEKTTQIVALQEDLAKKNVRIQELDEAVANLNENVENLATANAAQSEMLDAQDKALHTAYYCFGTSKELKAQNILSKKGIFSKTKVLQDGFNKDYFITIDIREVTEIPLFAGKAKLQSNHPEGSYEFIEDEDGNMTLKINNPESFWSLSKYLVIEVG